MRAGAWLLQATLGPRLPLARRALERPFGDAATGVFRLWPAVCFRGNFGDAARRREWRIWSIDGQRLHGARTPGRPGLQRAHLRLRAPLGT